MSKDKHKDLFTVHYGSDTRSKLNYTQAAQELRSVQVQLQNYTEELKVFNTLKDELIWHKDFNGTLPVTFYS